MEEFILYQLYEKINFKGKDILWNLALIPASVVLTALPTPRYDTTWEGRTDRK